MGARLARRGFAVMTGGGPGIMEAANRGAQGGGRSIGCNIELPRGQRANPTWTTSSSFRHFYVRKVMLVKYSYAFIALPAGSGARRDVRDRHARAERQGPRVPIVLIGAMLAPLTDFVRNRLLVEGTIDPGDEQRLQVRIRPRKRWISCGRGVQRFGLGRRAPGASRWYLGE